MTQSALYQCLNLYRLAASRCDDPVAYFGVHLSELNARLARGQQAAEIHFDPVTSAARVPGDDVRKHAIKFDPHKFQVAGVLEERAGRVEEPERGVDCVVLGRFTFVGKTIGQHALIDVPCERSQNAACHLMLAGWQSQTDRKSTRLN